MKLISRREISTLYDGFFIYRVQLLVLPKSVLLNLLSIILLKYLHIIAVERQVSN